MVISISNALPYLAIWNTRQTTIFPLNSSLSRCSWGKALSTHFNEANLWYWLTFSNPLPERQSSLQEISAEGLCDDGGNYNGLGVSVNRSRWLKSKTSPHTWARPDPKMLWVLKPVHFTAGFRPDALRSALRFRETKREGSCHVFVIVSMVVFSSLMNQCY